MQFLSQKLRELLMLPKKCPNCSGCNCTS